MSMSIKSQRPGWLNKKIHLNSMQPITKMLKDLRLNTVCAEALCPNISECFSKNQATFLILGNKCTRGCRFCGVDKFVPMPVDKDESRRVAEAVLRLGLKYVVITSVTRDDLDDGGASIFKETINAILSKNRDIKIELLIPDFKDKPDAIEIVVNAEPDVIGHNVECVPRLYPEIRPEADYNVSLNLLQRIKSINNKKRIYTKSGLMLGLGETKQEVLGVLEGLRGVGCDFLTLGQYLAPSQKHYPVREFIHPEDFEFYKNEAKKMGFLAVMSSPYARSSYRASEYFNDI